jgi:hypothetical protein
MTCCTDHPVREPATTDALIHDRALFQALVAEIRPTEPEIRTGAMFGCPAVFAGGRMAFCVYRDTVGVRLPAADAASLIAAGEATAFRPYNKPAMKEWVAIRMAPDDAARIVPVLTGAIAYARTLPATSANRRAGAVTPPRKGSSFP